MSLNKDTVAPAFLGVFEALGRVVSLRLDVAADQQRSDRWGIRKSWRYPKRRPQRISSFEPYASIFVENRGRASGSISKCSSFHMTKDTQKALAIIVASIGVLVGLLFWANHLRPHP